MNARIHMYILSINDLSVKESKNRKRGGPAQVIQCFLHLIPEVLRVEKTVCGDGWRY